MLYLHGNASTVASRMNVKHYTRLRELGLNVLAPEYRGYNGLAGVPSEASVAADARAAYDYLRTYEHVPAERLVIFGWSLGAAVAVELAATVDARGVVLEGAPGINRRHRAAALPDLPGALDHPQSVQRHRQRGADSRAAALPAQPRRRIVPFAEGRKLFDAAPSPKTFVEVRGGHVESSETDRDVFYGAIDNVPAF